MHREGDRDALIAELESTAHGCLGSDQFRTEAAEAATQLRDGAGEVRAGHTVYRVRENA